MMRKDSFTSLTDEASATTRPQVFVMLADPILEGVYRSRLQAAHYCTVWCEKGDGWKESLLAFDYDILVVDLSIFQGNPIENLTVVKKLAPEAELLVLSDSEDVRVAIAAFKTGIADYFLKPTNPETLAWAIDRIITRRMLSTSNEVLSADLAVFSGAHHISMGESDTKMRALAAKHLRQIFKAAGALWVWAPDPDMPGPERCYRTEAFAADEARSLEVLTEFRTLYGDLIERSFQGGLTSHPEQWVRDEFAWIPLKTPWMGGVLLFNINGTNDTAAQARAEFLVRNVEVALENHRRYNEVKQLTYVDDLTGLYNSRYLEISVESAIEEARKGGDSFSLLFIDIDKFKSVNDTHGHLVGSQMLVELANVLKKQTRKPDQVFRYGGDEFIVVLHRCPSKGALDVAERMRADVEKKRFFIQNKELRITLSIGVATFPEHGKDKKAIIKMADDAMFIGKKAGRNAVFIAGLMAPKSALNAS